jgi:uncharacterized protein (TIGR03437 family)
LTVTAANSLTLSATTVNFAFQVGGSVPGSQAVQINTSTGASVPFTATFTPSTTTAFARPNIALGPFVTISPTSGNTPATLTLTLNTAVVTQLAAGNYSGNVVISSPNLPGGNVMIKVNLTVSAATGPVIQAIVNAASFVAGPLSPGELISIFGTNLGPTSGILFTPDNGHVDTTLDDTVVMFNNTRAPLIFVSSSQINAIVPYEVASNSSVLVSVIHSGITTTSFNAAVAATAPGIFSAFQTGNGQGAILNSNLSPNNQSNPAPKGSVVSIYATGEGVLTPQPATGSMSGPSLPLPKPIANVSVTIGGQPADISYAGEAPTLVSGVLQVNAKIPNNIASGNQIVVLTIGNNSNKQQSITVAVQ